MKIQPENICKHEMVKCLVCGLEGPRYSVTATIPRKVRITPEYLQMRKACGKKGGRPKNVPVKTTPEKIAIAKQMYVEGKSREEIADFLGISIPASYTWVSGNKHKTPPPEKIAIAEQMFTEGKSRKEIAAFLELSISASYKLVKSKLK